MLVENRSGLLVNAEVRHATGRVEIKTVLDMLDRQVPSSQRCTIGADKLYDTREFVRESERLGFTTHVAEHQLRAQPGSIGRPLGIRATSSVRTGRKLVERASAG